MPTTELKAAVKACRAELKARGFTLVSSGGYRLGPVPVHARLARPRWYEGAPPHDWELHFGGPDAYWAPGGLDDAVFSYYQGHQQSAGNYYSVDTAEGVQRFVDDFHRKTLATVETATSPEALIDLLLRREIAPLGGFGKGNRKNADSFASAILRVATAYGVRDAYVPAVSDLLRPELEESPQRRAAAAEVARREGLQLT